MIVIVHHLLTTYFTNNVNRNAIRIGNDLYYDNYRCERKRHKCMNEKKKKLNGLFATKIDLMPTNFFSLLFSTYFRSKCPSAYKMLFTTNAIVNRQFRHQRKLLKQQQQPTLLLKGNKHDLLGNDAKFKILKKVHYFVILFSKSSTIHGFTYLAQRGLHIVERLVNVSQNYF